MSYASPSTDRSNSIFLPWGLACRFWFDPASEALRLLHESRSCRNPLQNLWQAILELIGCIEQDLPWLLRRVAPKGLAMHIIVYYQSVHQIILVPICIYIYIHIWVISSISSACDGGKEVLRLTWCLLPKKCGMPASKVLWSFRQSCTLASSASGFYGIQFLVYAIFAYPYRISNAFKRTMSLCAWYIMIHHAKVWSSNLCPLSLNV